MDPELWRRIESVFHQALELDESLRRQFLDRECGGNQELRREVESLLVMDSPAKKFFGDPTADNPTESERSRNTEGIKQSKNQQGVVIGSYRLISLIDEGGMGEVWLAEQESPVHRQVAVKLIKAGMDTREWIARFQSERQAVAMMDHPSIAKVFDAGTSPDGRPYFVMEYVPGLPITTYCDRNKLNLRQRLELFTLVCDGVQHAHQKAVIHRDLKPSNILVIEVDGKAVPRIIDFGVAKAVSRQIDADTFVTDFGSIIGTLGYMSPEQADKAGEDIDVRSDVYSLGVILYELLAGSLPLDFYRMAYDEVLRRLREQDPPSPSTKVRSLPDTGASTAQNRGVDAPTLLRQLRGDPDAIALKALEKNRNRRYASASDLASDIRRLLENEPVTAHPPSASYRARKYIRRHRVLVFSLAAVFIALACGVSVSTWQAIRARRAESRAEREAASEQAVVDFLQKDLLAQAGPYSQSESGTPPDPDIKVRTALDRAAERIQGKFDKQPEIEASIRNTIGRSYDELGVYPEAHRQFERALEIRQRVLGAENQKTVETMAEVGEEAMFSGNSSEAERLLSKALEISRRTLGPENKDTLIFMRRLAEVYITENKYNEAEALDIQSAEIARRTLGPENRDTVRTIAELASVYLMQRKYEKAEAVYKQTLEIERRTLRPGHPDILITMNNLALCENYLGKYAEAESLQLETVEVGRRVMGAAHPETLQSMMNLGVTYRSAGEFAKSEELLAATIDGARRAEGPEDGDVLRSMTFLASVYGLQGRYAEGEALCLKALQIEKRVLGVKHVLTLEAESDLAFLYQSEGKYLLAKDYAAQALDARKDALGMEEPETLDSEADLALAYESLGDFAKSEVLARIALEADRKIQPDDWQRYRAESLVGASLAGEKKYAEAEPLLLESYAGMNARKSLMGAQNRYHLDQARRWIGSLYQTWGKPERAAQWIQNQP